MLVTACFGPSLYLIVCLRFSEQSKTKIVDKELELIKLEEKFLAIGSKIVASYY